LYAVVNDLKLKILITIIKDNVYTAEATTTDGHKASRGLSARAELLVREYAHKIALTRRFFPAQNASNIVR